ncbi:putative protein tyrosine kinase [Lyophyllum shimeji]|uniref:Protein kinase domain-containing protein n=1 Tax=Lyophyllum shimeji TaxID=47721 RepID=A0A9P3UKP7_LYOSH|nr:putative protein tyrosine kinase [Lyophyllum shimeji]
MTASRRVEMEDLDYAAQVKHSPSAVQQYLRELGRATRTLPYGSGLLKRVVAHFSSVPQRFLYHELTAAQKYLVTKCQEAYLLLADGAKDHTYWIKHHESIRTRMVEWLSYRRSIYVMDEAELGQWCKEVFHYLRKCLNRSGAVPSERQLCIDALHDLLELAWNESDDRVQNLRYQNYFIKSCQRISCCPTSLITTLPMRSPKDPNRTGGTAVVFHGFHNRQEVAIKHFDRCHRVIKKRVVKEALILQLLYHPNIIPFIGVVDDSPRRFCIITPWMRNGDIVEFLKNNHDASRKDLLEQVADALHFLHDSSIVHGDLKGGNILINDEEQACLCDVGLATIQDEAGLLRSPTATSDPGRLKLLLDLYTSALVQRGRPPSMASTLSSRMSTLSDAGTLQWMAPERIDPSLFGLLSAKATFASDVFSFAMLAVEIYSGKVPYYPKLPMDAGIHIVHGELPARPPNVPDPVWAVIEDCRQHEAAKRPSILTVYNRLACIP